jgi:dienelactone hydrolase
MELSNYTPVKDADHAEAVMSQSPVILSAQGRDHELQVRVSAPVTGSRLPIIMFSHGFGSSKDAYAPLVNYWASHGFVVIQPTFLDSKTLGPNPAANHNEAVKAYLKDPRKPLMWLYRVEDVKSILDQLDFIEESVSWLKGRLDRTRIAAVGHSFGAQTTATLLGARVVNADGSLSEDLSDDRIKAGILICAGGQSGDALSAFAKEHFTHLSQSYAEMTKPSLVIAGDNDNSPLTVIGPKWFTGAYYLSPGANALVTLFGGEHLLGGISGYLVTETTDENPDRVAAVQRLSWSYLRSALYPEDNAWNLACSWLQENLNPLGKFENK